ncbi:MAG TPA: hypothetical protein VI338_04275 [Nitrososphaera sp.]|nr:hypothetical protein [Nitrososphaera sp.]
MQKEILLRCIFDSLSLFGENTKAALLDKLQQEGVGFTPETFDIAKFSIVAENLLGRSADFIFVKIADDFCNQTKTSLEEIGIANSSSNSRILQSLFRLAK